MELTSVIYSAMYAISTSLLYPVIFLLIILVIYSVMMLGEFIAESARRFRNKDSLSQNRNSAMVREFLENLSKLKNPSKTDLEKLVEEAELKAARELEIPRILSRIGPMLGLMGTLIPMGPAMIALSRGNVQELAMNLITAFATTVLGLIVGGISYTVFTVKRRWFLEDLSDIEYISRKLGGEREKEAF